MAIFDRIIHQADRFLSFLLGGDIIHRGKYLFFISKYKTGTNESEVILQSQFTSKPW
ncbi:hypothetical protein ECBG_04265 [Enterococcus casseliflavus EC20]|uniref:Uncharacterized protein n=1 Tax=Enterococcus casseliflavus EC20 TaxID=565655 RepID=M9T8S6_ENTCA|nr:hypothetical protein [Enterococcus casseliflavus]AGJ01218.1 hypothetical protein ECBG_04265 [Enterococcus casseliflavus EC20]